MSNNTTPNEHHWQVLVLLLKEIAQQKNITQQEIAEATGFTQGNIARIFSLKYSPTLANFIAIAQALEVNFFFEDKDGKSDLNIAFEKAMEELGRRHNPLRNN